MALVHILVLCREDRPMHRACKTRDHAIGIKPKTASFERLFKEWGAQATEARNRMALSTLTALTTV